MCHSRLSAAQLPAWVATASRSMPRTSFPQQRSQSEKLIYLEVRREMNLEDTTRLCPKEQRKSEQTSQQSKPQAGTNLGLLELLLQLFKKRNGNATGDDFCSPWGGLVVTSKLYRFQVQWIRIQGKTNEKPSVDPSPIKQDFFRNRLALANDLDQGIAV